MVTKKIHLTNFDEALRLFGARDENLKDIEHRLDVQIFSRQSHARGDFIISVRGASGKVDKAIDMINEFRQHGQLNKSHRHLHIETHGKYETIVTTPAHKHISPRTPHQKDYVDAIGNYDVVISTGPAGTGKTFLAVASSIKALYEGKISKIVLTRPVVEAGEKLGFLPGTLYEKVEPYLKPLYDAFTGILGAHKFRTLKEDEVIEIIPLAYMRGRTIDDAFIILDEAQNTTFTQMKMFLTRLGFGSKAVVTGDITQIDLEKKNFSGLLIATQVLKDINEIKFISFTEEDVVRHHVVKKIISACETWEFKSK